MNILSDLYVIFQMYASKFLVIRAKEGFEQRGQVNQ